MEREFVGFIGAGLAMVFEELDERGPRGTVCRGYELVAHLSRVTEPRFPALIARTVAVVLEDWRAAKLPLDVALTHLQALPALIDAHRPPAGMLIGAFAQIRSSAAAEGIVTRCSARLTSGIVERVRAGDMLERQGLHETIVYFFLDRLLGSLLADSDLIAALRSQFAAFAAGEAGDTTAGLDTEPAAANPHATPHAETEPAPSGVAGKAAELAVAGEAGAAAEIESAAEIAGIPAAALAGAVAAGTDRGLSGTWLEDRARDVADLVAELRVVSSEHQGETRQQLEDAAAAVSQGALAEAAGLIARAEQALLGSPPAATCPQAARVRTLLARIAESGGHWQGAAAHYAVAGRLLPSADRLGRWRYQSLQARALSRGGEEARSAEILSQAAHLYADCGGLVSEQDEPLEWAAVQVDLGRLLLQLGRLEDRLDRYLAAAVHFKPALETFSRMKASEEWARAQLGLADALEAQAQVQGDVATLGEAAFAYRAVLGIATRDRLPEAWASASFGLAAALVRLAEETGETASLDEAIAALRALVGLGGRLAPARRAQASVRLGHALLTRAAASGDQARIDQAIAAFRAALSDGTDHLAPADLAGAQSALGTALWALGDAMRDVALATDAARAKLAALDILTELQDEPRASLLRRELGELEQLIDDLMAGSAEAGGVPAAGADEQIADHRKIA